MKNLETDGEQSRLLCPVCGDNYQHAGTPVRIDGGMLCCRDDTGKGGLLIPIWCEQGHDWGIALANHKGREYLQVFPTLGDIPMTGVIESRGYFMRDAVVKFYKSSEKGGNGAFATATTATDADEFLRECAKEIEAVITARHGDIEFTFNAVFPQICELWAKLKGYKADVFERRLLVVGEPMPEAHMDCLNAPAQVDEVLA